MPRSVRSQRNRLSIIVMAAAKATVVVLNAVPISPITLARLSPISSTDNPPNAEPKWITVPKIPSTGATQQMKRIRP